VSGVDGSGSPTAGLELPAGTSGWSTLNGQPFDVSVNGDRGLRIDPASDGTNPSPNVIGGSEENSVAAGVHSATISGGGRADPSDPGSANRVTDNQGTVGGGAGNQAGDGAGTTAGEFATVGGGNSNQASGNDATVGGGEGNTASEADATVGGGFFNTASSGFSTVVGGANNTASDTGATVLGGTGNTAQADLSLAAGSQASADHTGAFVWADSSNFGFPSTAQDQFSVRATGGVRFVSAIDPNLGDPTAGVELAPGGGSWASLSDKNSKTKITPVSGRAVLRKLVSVPISEWSYRAQGPSVRHIGPMAQDLSRAFGVGEDSRHITSVDADGISLAAIKGLHSELRAERRRRHRLERRLDGLEARLAALEHGVNR
jgi:hypothetical protein